MESPVFVAIDYGKRDFTAVTQYKVTIDGIIKIISSRIVSLRHKRISKRRLKIRAKRNDKPSKQREDSHNG